MDDKVWFSTGRGRGFDMRENKVPAKTNKERVVPVEIDLDDLNKPGVGPMNFDPKKGMDCLDGDKD